MRRRTPQFAGGRLVPFHTHNPHVLGYQRPGTSDGGEPTILVLANFGDTAQHLDAATLGGMPETAEDLINGGRVPLRDGLTLDPHGFRWLRV